MPATTAVSAAAGAALGSGAPSQGTFGQGSNDKSMTVYLGTGTSGLTTGVLCVITLGGNYTSPVGYPSVRAWCNGKGTYGAPLQAYVSATTQNTITISCRTAPGTTGLPASANGIIIDVWVDA